MKQNPSPTCPYCGNWQKIYVWDIDENGEEIEIYDCCDCNILYKTCELRK